MQELDLRTTLKKSLDDARRIALLGVGSELRADDIAGMLVSKAVEEQCKKDGGCPHLAVFHGETAPENLTGEIKKFQPTHLVVVDAADTGAEPGTIMLIRPEDVLGISFSTHMMPLKLLIDYLNQSFPCTPVIIGIQPKTLSFGLCPSKEVQNAAQELSGIFSELILSLQPQKA